MSEGMHSLPESHCFHLLRCINWFELKNTEIVDTDKEKDISVRCIAFTNLKFCARLKNDFNMKIKYYQNDSAFFLVKIEEQDYDSLLNIVLQHATGDFYVI